MDQYVVRDRITGLNKALKVNDESFLFEDTLDEALNDPIVADKINNGKAYTLFVSDGQFGFEESAVVVDHEIDVVDAVTDFSWRLAVRDGQFFWFRAYQSSLTRTLVSIIALDGEKTAFITTTEVVTSLVLLANALDCALSVIASQRSAINQSRSASTVIRQSEAGQAAVNKTVELSSSVNRGDV